MGGFQNRPNAIVCKGCGGQYFVTSLPIHQKTCFQRNAFVDIVCIKCRGVVKSGRYHDHVANCTGPPPVQASSTPLQPPRWSRPEVSADQLNTPEADGRVRCRNCDRGFHHDRIAKHHSVCAGTRRRLRNERSKSDTESQTARRDLGGDLRQQLHRPQTQASAVLREPLLSRIGSNVPRASGLNAVRMKLVHTSLGVDRRASSSSQSSSLWQGRPASKHYDVVHRDFSSSSKSCGGKLDNLSTSTATSAANPLATAMLMTIQRL